MRERLLFTLVSLVAAIVMSAAVTSLSAAPISKATSSLPSTEPSYLSKAQYGCGWDYACPPHPWYGRRIYRTPQVYIENNYGTVNVYQTPRRTYRKPAYSWRRWRDRDYEDSRAYYDWRHYKRCDGDVCGESCGLVCWYRRIRDGYCGHGCQTYREQARDERDYPDCREDDCPTPPRYRYRPRERYDDVPPVRFERPSNDERVPLRRFNGPKYP
jgi:hypothetical protein